MNKTFNNNLINSIKFNLKKKSMDELFDMLDEFRHAWRFLGDDSRGSLLIDQTLYLIELDRRIQNVA